MTTPERRFAELVGTDASRPFVTYYDEATGERSELSRKSLANWVAKTHHLLTDELGLGVGDTAFVAVPAHWISVPIVLGCLTAGLTLSDTGDRADVAFTAPDTIADAAGLIDRFVIDPGAAAVGFRGDVPGKAADYVAAVRPQADAWTGVLMPAGPDDLAFGTTTRGEAMARAATRADEFGLDDGGRLLSTAAWNTPADWVDAVIVPLAVRGSLVLVRNADDDVAARRAEQERATARL